jgi:hypothetical protein
MARDPKRFALALLLLLLGVAALRDLSRLGAAAPWNGMDDLADFYCAGDALDRGRSPYTYEPLRSCEHRANTGATFRAQLFAANPGVAAPAPQPAYDFLPFMGLAKLPFGTARTVTALGILTAVVLCAALLSALLLPWEVVAASLVFSTAYEAINTGQIVPFALLALAGSGLALARGRDELAGIFAALVAIEPATGVPVIAAVLIFVPRARITVGLTVAALGGCSMLLVGSAGVMSYVTTVLPAHAAAELHFPYQYSLTYVAAYFGAGPDVARIAGAVSYVTLFIVALALGVRTSQALRRPELVVFLPALCSVLGGTFVHAEELCFALPALLVFSTALQGALRVVSALALCLLSIPWILVWGEKQLFLASLFVCAVILIRLRLDLRSAVGALCAIAAAIYLFELHPPHLPAPSELPRAYAPTELVQNEWQAYAEGRRTDDPLWFAIRLPSWAALAAGLIVAIRVSRRPAKV